MPNTSNKSNKSIRRKRGGRRRNSENKNFGSDDGIEKTNNDSFATRHRVSFKPKERSNINMSKSLASIPRDDLLKEIISNNIIEQALSVELNKKCFFRDENGTPLCEEASCSKLKTFDSLSMKWHKIEILCNEENSQDHILNTLQKAAMGPFQPLMVKTSERKVTFYVNNRIAANNIIRHNPLIKQTHGLKVYVKLGSPEFEITDDLIDKIKQVIYKRYVYHTSTLDLSRFCHDPDFITEYFCPLHRPNVMELVLDIVHKCLPTLGKLILDGNMLNTIKKLDVLDRYFPHLRILSLRDNKIDSIKQLQKIKALRLQELRLTGNPLLSRLSKDDYIRNILEIFPGLLKLDDMNLSALMFDNIIEMPPQTQQLFLRNGEEYDIASQFLKEYFSFYDSNNRHQLLDAYDEDACFSLTVTNNKSLHSYLGDNRNLFMYSEDNGRLKLLKQGKSEILSHITKLPQTKHHSSSFKMDVTIISPKLMFLEVTGLFSELNNQLRYFSRTFTIVPKENCYCISIEQLYISLPTKEQRKTLRANNLPMQEITNKFNKMELKLGQEH